MQRDHTCNAITTFLGPGTPLGTATPRLTDGELPFAGDNNDKLADAAAGVGKVSVPPSPPGSLAVTISCRNLQCSVSGAGQHMRECRVILRCVPQLIACMCCAA